MSVFGILYVCPIQYPYTLQRLYLIFIFMTPHITNILKPPSQGLARLRDHLKN